MSILRLEFKSISVLNRLRSICRYCRGLEIRWTFTITRIDDHTLAGHVNARGILPTTGSIVSEATDLPHTIPQLLVHPILPRPLALLRLRRAFEVANLRLLPGCQA